MIDGDSAIPPPIREAAERAVQPDRLLRDEDPSTTRIDDVVHWLRVYGELIDFKTEMLRLTDRHLAAMTDDAAREIHESDRLILMAELARFARRRDFWRERAAELRARSHGET